MSPPVTFVEDRLAIHFDCFDLDAYRLFLRAKRLPESSTEFHPEDETYTLSAPARFAPMLGVEVPETRAQDLPLAKFLFDDQAAIVRMALDAKRFAVWSDCGLGKTLVGLEWARHVAHRTGGRVLIVTMHEIVHQWIDEARAFYRDRRKKDVHTLDVLFLRTRAEMIGWMKDGRPGLAITNYEKWNPPSPDEQVVSEARSLAGIVLDESSRLKTGGGKQKWSLIKSCRGIEYKLSLTATPAPNDIMEFASQASFLEKMRSEGEILWTYFTRDPKTHRWTVKPHARAAFFEFMASWSIYVRDPRRYGWRKGMAEVPPPEVLVHEIEPTGEQRKRLVAASADANGQLSFLDDQERNFVQAGRLSQIAKGFRYVKGSDGVKRDVPENPATGKVRGVFPRFERIDSHKPSFVADLIRSEVAAGLQVLVWTVFDAESEILAEHLERCEFAACNRCNAALPGPGTCPSCGSPEFRWTSRGDPAFGGRSPLYDLLTGKVKPSARLEILGRFRRGESKVLVSRAAMLGYGMNFQFCGSMVFSGWNFSYESYYQALRRAYRYGQTKRLRVHIPVVKGLEEDMLDAIFRKQDEHEKAIAEMERCYVEVRGSFERMKEVG